MMFKEFDESYPQTLFFIRWIIFFAASHLFTKITTPLTASFMSVSSQSFLSCSWISSVFKTTYKQCRFVQSLCCTQDNYIFSWFKDTTFLTNTSSNNHLWRQYLLHLRMSYRVSRVVPATFDTITRSSLQASRSLLDFPIAWPIKLNFNDVFILFRLLYLSGKALTQVSKT